MPDKNLRILLIDDDEDDQLFFMQALQEVKRNATFESALNGEIGLRKLMSDTMLPDYIFLDLNMPKIHGMDVLKQIKKTQNLQHIPVIICSTSMRTNDMATAKSLGAHEYITKPTTMRDLANIIRRILGDSA